jgi:indole-3-glycerol phosphate synthase
MGQARFIRTQTVLDKILDNTAQEVAARQQITPLAVMIDAAERTDPPRDFAGALRRETVALIAEVKHASPSRGVLVDPFDPVALATTYAANGAAAISVLTDARFFQGSLDDLRAVRAAVDVPVLRKDFVLDFYQVYEARAAGANAVLLIVAALDDAQLADLYALVRSLDLTALVEVHDEAELDRALHIGARVIGINNRDLHTFNVDLGTTARLAQRVPARVTLVAESGVHRAADVEAMAAAGARAVLVGEAVVQANDTAARVRELSGVPVKGAPEETTE